MRPPIDPASTAAAAALESDPFYRSITVELAADAVRRRAALAGYFDYSIGQGQRIGRVVHPKDARDGVAVWVLPQVREVEHRERLRKDAFLHQVLGAAGCANYHAIVDYMSGHARSVVGTGAWYLSIIAVHPQQQRRGLGAQLLAPTLAEADSAGVVSYLETFNAGSHGFYERHGFTTRGEFTEPTTASRYAIMAREPRP